MKKMKIVKKNDLEINRLSKVYINKKIKTIALKEVSFNVKRGAMLALLGPNGAGKSTLINILAGIVNKSSGSAHINGYNIDNDIHYMEDNIENVDNIQKQIGNVDKIHRIKHIIPQ